MKAIVLASALVVVAESGAGAAPGDPRVLEGTLEWPSVLTEESFAVIRADDGQAYYADVSTATRRTLGTLVSGDRVIVTGVEGVRPYELAASVLGSRDAAPNGVAPASTSAPTSALAPSPVSTPPAGPAPGAPDLWRLHGRVVSVGPRTVTLQIGDGAEHTVDISALTAPTRASLRRGDEISLYGEPQTSGRLVANGYLQMEPPAPAASPRTAPATR